MPHPQHSSHQSIMRVRRSLAETIELSTGIRSDNLLAQYLKVWDKWVRDEGLHHALSRAKMCNLIIIRYLGDNPKPTVLEPWVATDSEGFPRCLSFLKRFLKDHSYSPASQQATLSVLGYFKAVKLSPKGDFKSIVTNGKEVEASVTEQIIQVGKESNWDLTPKTLRTPECVWREKHGPNGHATLKSHIDALALGPLTDHIIAWLGNQGFMIKSSLTTMQQKTKIPENTIPKVGTLGLKAEPGGKTRVFAMVDYWTQVALEPLHHRVMEILRSLPQDCTFDQHKADEALRSWSLSGQGFALDLTKATDRFPVEFQEKLLDSCGVGPELSSSWRKLMSDRPFTYKRETYRWAVGQPLGAMSSWAVFTLSHHCVVRYCHKKIGAPLDYYILGDDLIIRDPRVSDLYRHTMSVLGVDVSSDKSLSGHALEFTKRIFIRGHEVSPVPIPMLQNLLKDNYSIREFVAKLRSRSSVCPTDLRLDSFLERLRVVNPHLSLETLKILSKSPPKLVGELDVPLLSAPSQGNTYIWWNRRKVDLNDLLNVWNDLVKVSVIQELRICRLRKNDSFAALNKTELTGLAIPSRRIHPAYQSLGTLDVELSNALADFNAWGLSRSHLKGIVPRPTVPTLTAVLEPRSKKSVRHTSRLILKVWQKIATTHIPAE